MLQVETLAPYMGQSQAELATTLGPEEARRFARDNPDTYDHMIRVGAMVGFVLTKEGTSADTVQLGVRMGVAHDIGKDGLATNSDVAWTPERIKAFREEHSRRGADQILTRWADIPDARALHIATGSHHDQIPDRYYRLTATDAQMFGLLQLVQAADRWDAFATRPYARQTGAGLSPEEAMDKWVVNGRPHSMQPTAVVDGQTVEFQPYLLDLVEVK